MDAGSRAPTVGALGDAGAIAEKAGMRVLNKKFIGIGISFQLSFINIISC